MQISGWRFSDALAEKSFESMFYGCSSLEELDMDTCPVCGSKNLTKIDRMNGYLSYSRVKGDTRLNEAKMAEIAERKSM